MQDRALTVTPGNIPPGAALPFDPQHFAGTFKARSVRISASPSSTGRSPTTRSSRLTGSIRKETDLRDFGGQTALIARQRSSTTTSTPASSATSFRGNGFVNEATVDYLKSDLEVRRGLRPGVRPNYAGRDPDRRPRRISSSVKQEGLTFRDNLSFTTSTGTATTWSRSAPSCRSRNISVGGTGPNANPQFELRFDPQPRTSTSCVPELVRFRRRQPQLQGEHDPDRPVRPGRLGGEPII